MTSAAYGVKLEPQNKDAISLNKKAFWNLKVVKNSATVFKLTSFNGSALSSSNYGSLDISGTMYDVTKDINLTQGVCNTMWGSASDTTVYLYAGYGNTYATSVSNTSPSTDISGGSDTNFKIAVDGNPAVSVTLTLTGLSSGAAIATGLTSQINSALAAANQGARVDVVYGTLYTITSRLLGARSSVVVTDGLSLNVADNLKIGVTNSGVEVAGIKGLALCESNVSAKTTVGSTAIGNSGYTACSLALPSTAVVRQIASNALSCTGPTINATITDAQIYAPGTIANADISSSAAVSYSKLNLTSSVVVADLAAPVMKEVTGTLTQAQLQAIGTPISAIAAGGAGTVHIVDEVELLHTYSTAAYATGSDLAVEYGTTGDNITLVDSTFVTDTASSNKIIKPSSYALDGATGSATGFDVTLNANKPVQFQASNFTNGNVANIVKYRIRYHTVTLQN